MNPQLAQLFFEKVQKTDGVTEIPYDRWDVDEYFDPSPNAVGRILGVGLAGCWSDSGSEHSLKNIYYYFARVLANLTC